MTADGGCVWDVVHKMNEEHKGWGVLNSRGLGIKAKKCLYERHLNE